MFGAQEAAEKKPSAASPCAGSVASSTVKVDRKGMFASPAWRYCRTRFTPSPPGMKVKTASGRAAAMRASSAEKSSWVRGT